MVGDSFGIGLKLVVASVLAYVQIQFNINIIKQPRHTIYYGIWPCIKNALLEAEQKKITLIIEI